MFKRIAQWFHRERAVIYPFRGLLAAMDNKDHALLEEVGPLPVAAAVERWREVYPEDFPNDQLIIVGKPHG
jgi:hypothetical protein